MDCLHLPQSILRPLLPKPQRLREADCTRQRVSGWQSAASPVRRCGRPSAGGIVGAWAGPGQPPSWAVRTPLHPLGGLQVEPLPAVAHPRGISPSPLALVFVECMRYVFFCAVALAGTSGTRVSLLFHSRWSWENTITVPSTHMTQAGATNPPLCNWLRVASDPTRASGALPAVWACSS